MLGRAGANRGRITSFFRAARSVGRSARSYAAAAAAARAVRNVVAGARRRVTPTPYSSRVPKFKGRVFAGFPEKPFVTGAGGVSSHTFSLVNQPSGQVASMARLGAPNISTLQSTEELVAAAGFQVNKSITYLSTLDLGVIAGRIGVAPSGPMRYVLSSLLAETVMTNMSTAPMDLEIWDLVLKRDLPVQNNTQWKIANGTIVTDSLAGTPEDYWATGARAGTAVDVTAPDPSVVIGSTPYDSQLFKDMFRVVKKTNVILNQGASHRILANQSINKLVDQAVWAAATQITSFPSRTAGSQGLTSYTLIRAKGMPCTIDPTVGSGVTTSAARLAVVTTQRVKYTWIQDYASTVSYTSALQSPASGAGIINIGNGTGEDQTFAPGA